MAHFGLNATRHRANAGLKLAAEHFTTQGVAMSSGSLAVASAVADEGDFSTFTVSLLPAGPFAAAVDVTETQTVYIAAASPYRLVLPAVITIS